MIYNVTYTRFIEYWAFHFSMYSQFYLICIFCCLYNWSPVEPFNEVTPIIYIPGVPTGFACFSLDTLQKSRKYWVFFSTFKGQKLKKIYIFNFLLNKGKKFHLVGGFIYLFILKKYFFFL